MFYDYMYSIEIMISNTSVIAGIGLLSLLKPNYFMYPLGIVTTKLITLKVNYLFHSFTVFCDPFGLHAYA